MEAAMAEMELDETKDGEEDADYTNDKGGQSLNLRAPRTHRCRRGGHLRRRL